MDAIPQYHLSGHGGGNGKVEGEGDEGRHQQHAERGGASSKEENRSHPPPPETGKKKGTGTRAPVRGSS